MAISFIGSASAMGGSLTSQTVDISAIAWQPGDLGVALVGSDDDALPHSGGSWTLLGTTTTGAVPDRGMTLWAKQLLAGENETPSFATPANCHVLIGIWRELDITLACSAAVLASPHFDFTPIAPNITATGSGLLIVGAFDRSTGTVPTVPPGTISRAAVTTGSRNLSLADKPIAAAGAVVPGSWASGTSEYWCTCSVVFAPEITTLSLTGVRATMNKIGETL